MRFVQGDCRCDRHNRGETGQGHKQHGDIERRRFLSRRNGTDKLKPKLSQARKGEPSLHFHTLFSVTVALRPVRLGAAKPVRSAQGADVGKSWADCE